MAGKQIPSGCCVSIFVHAVHAPWQAVLQQTPSTQNPLEHWLLAEHASPLANVTAKHLPPWQEKPGTQSVSTLQDVAHSLPLHDAYGLQLPAPGIMGDPTHDPWPLHMLAGVTTPAVQVWAVHGIPGG
jgi:hypothetical protein